MSTSSYEKKENEPTPRFTGFFIPIEIWEIEGLSLFEMILLSWIDALYSPQHGGCFASNEYLAKKMRNVKQNTVVKALVKLRRLGLIEDVSFDGKQRVIRALIGKFMDRGKAKAGCDKNHRGGVKKITPSPTPSLYTYNKEEIYKAQAPPSELPFGQISRSFFDQLKENNPKIKKPDLKKWAREFELLSRRDGNSIDDIQKVIDYVFSTRDMPSDNGFCWANVILSPQNLRKHFARIWAEMKKPKRTSSQSHAFEHKKLAERIEKKFKERIDINVCNDYIEFVNGPTSKVYEYGSKNFVENCMIQLQNRKLKL